MIDCKAKSQKYANVAMVYSIGLLMPKNYSVKLSSSKGTHLIQLRPSKTPGIMLKSDVREYKLGLPPASHLQQSLT